MNRIRGFTALVMCAATLLPVLACAQAVFSKGGRLVTVVPGIRDEASDSWVGTAAALSPTRDRWVVREEGVGEYAHLTEVPGTHIITIRTNASPAEVRDAVRPIAGVRDVTVIVDMKLGWNVTESGWAPHTKWAATVSETLAETHAAEYPNAHSLYVGHSAGTEPVAIMPDAMPDIRRAGGARAGGRPLYDDILVLSGRRSPDDPGYPKHAVLAFADGDFYSNPRGHIGAGAVFKTYGEEDAIAFAKQGYAVVRMLDNASTAWDVPLAHRKTEHTIITDVTAPDRQTIYYNPTTAQPVAMPTASLANIMKCAVDVEAGRTGTIEQAVGRLKSAEPTPGIGGISLNATAYVPVDPRDVDSAGYDAQRRCLSLRLKSGGLIAFPEMDPEALRQAYDTTYVGGEKAELSIGSNRTEGPDGKEVLNLQQAGKDSVYYFGRSRDTLLGLVMFKADSMLGELAFTTSPAVRDVARRVPGFHSMVELFPEKYAASPAQSRFLGYGERVFLTPRTVMLERTPDGRALRFADFAASIRFGHTGPAEAAYSAFFESHMAAILATGSGGAIANLIPYARAAAVFRWMRDNSIQFEHGALQSIESAQVFTPDATDVFEGPKLEDVAVSPPTVFYNLSGPTRVILADGRESTLSYTDGKVTEVRRYDGLTLRVYRDDVGMPNAVQWAGGSAIAFMAVPRVGLTEVRNVALKIGEYGVSVSLRRDSMYYPIVNPESIVARLAVRFANGETDL